MAHKYFILIFSILFLSLGLSAQENAPKTETIFKSLSKTDSTTHASVKFFEDRRIEQLVNYKKISTVTETGGGFRVQVFSSNTQRTAKTEAFRLERQIREEFPEYGVYVNYISPFWKVRVGDFKTRAQAQEFRTQLINSFPQLRSEAYIVREQISISGAK